MGNLGELVADTVKLAGDIGALRAERDALRTENDFLRGLLERRMADTSATRQPTDAPVGEREVCGNESTGLATVRAFNRTGRCHTCGELCPVPLCAKCWNKIRQTPPAAEPPGVSEGTLDWLHRIAGGANSRRTGVTPADAAAILHKLGVEP